jgi:hypothetical protein
MGVHHDARGRKPGGPTGSGSGNRPTPSVGLTL